MSEFKSRTAWRRARTAYTHEYVAAAQAAIDDPTLAPDWVLDGLTPAEWAAKDSVGRLLHCRQSAVRIWEEVHPLPAPDMESRHRWAARRNAPDPAAVAASEARAQRLASVASATVPAAPARVPADTPSPVVAATPVPATATPTPARKVIACDCGEYIPASRPMVHRGCPARARMRPRREPLVID
jgi:hypothetical protein